MTNPNILTRNIRNLEEELYPYAIALGALTVQCLSVQKAQKVLEGLSYHTTHGEGQLTFSSLLDYMKKEVARNLSAFRLDFGRLERPDEVEEGVWVKVLAYTEESSPSMIFIDAFLGLMEQFVLPKTIAFCAQEGYPFTLESEHLSEARHIINRVLKSFVRSYCTDFDYRRISLLRLPSRMKTY